MAAAMPTVIPLCKLSLALTLITPHWTATANPIDTTQLNQITVTANRSGTSNIDQTAATIAVITATDIEQQNAKDIKEALRYEPGVAVRRSTYRPSGITSTLPGSSGRGGNESISIRGLDGNRILMLEDGVPLPRAYSFGAGSNGRGAYADSDLYQRIEILRGPASSLYGSDGLTGAVNFVTKDPADLLGIFHKPNYFSIKPSYDSEDRSFGSTAAAAFGGERWQGLLILKNREGHAASNKGDNDSTGSNRTRPDPLNYTNRSALGKLVFKTSPHDTFKLTLETIDNRLNSIGLSNFSNAITDYRSNSNLSSNRIGLHYEHHNPDNHLIQTLRAAAYYRRAASTQYLFEGGSGSGRPRERNVAYNDNTLGGSIVAESNFDTHAFKHKLVYGLDASLARISTSATGTGWNSCTGSQYCEAFPKTDYTVLGAYLQDEIRYGAFSMLPGLRFDSYHLKPQSSSKYDQQAQANGQPAVASKGSALSPRLAFLYTISPALVPYVQYARGFRAPSPNEVNSFYKSGGYSQFYQQISNPDLKPESSDSFELGLRGKLSLGNSAMRYSSAAFTGSYRNFIDLATVGGNSTAADPTTYQYINASRAKIHGAEARLDWMLNNGITLKTGMAYTKGSKTNQKGLQSGIDSVSPFTAVLGLRYAPVSTWFVQTDLVYNAAKNRHDIEPNSQVKPPASAFATPSFTIVDLSSGYRVNKQVMLYAGIRNLFDRKYWNWNDVRGLSLKDDAPNLAAYTAPGRSFNVSLKLEY